MKTPKYFLPIVSGLLPFLASAGQINFEYEGIEDFTDFSVSGLSEEKTLPLFEAELSPEAEFWAKNHVADGHILTIHFTDIDMAGDIQPWRNTYNADIRYVEAVYPPRIRFRYTLTDGEGNLVREGKENLSDLAFQTNSIASLRMQHQNFYYEVDLLSNWIRRSFRKE